MTDRLWCFKDLRGETWNENNCMIWWVEKQERLCNKQKSCVIRMEPKPSTLSPGADYNNKELFSCISKWNIRHIKPLLDAAEIMSVSDKAQSRQLRGIWASSATLRTQHWQSCTAETKPSGHRNPLQGIVRQNPPNAFSKVLQLPHLWISLTLSHKGRQRG